MGDATPASGSDLRQGVPLADIPRAGVFAGQVDGEPVLLAWVDGRVHAVSGRCSHYGAPLADGLRRGDVIHCPWHHACFSLRDGAALKAPAFADLPCWQVEERDGLAYVRGRDDDAHPRPRPRRGREDPERIAIVGAGAAGYAAAVQLRALGYAGAIDLFGADPEPPYDRPNLSKDYLAGTAPAEWIPLQGPDFYAEQGIRLHLGRAITALDPHWRQLTDARGDKYGYERLLLAPGAVPNRLPLPGFDAANVCVLRSLADADALLARIAHARRLVLVGAGFIGLEAAAALRARGLAVDVVAPEPLPLGGVLGEALADDLLRRHREHGVAFHLGRKPQAFDGGALLLDDGTRLDCDALLLGVGVKPDLTLARAAGLAVDDGIVVDATLQTAIPGIYAAGDAARFPYRGQPARVEHWVHAQRQGQVAAANLLGAAQAFRDPPFFWTHHYGTDLRYLGLGRGFDRVEVDGDPAADDCLVRYFRGDTLLAAAAIGRDRALLELEPALRG